MRINPTDAEYGAYHHCLRNICLDIKNGPVIKKDLHHGRIDLGRAMLGKRDKANGRRDSLNVVAVLCCELMAGRKALAVPLD